MSYELNHASATFLDTCLSELQQCTPGIIPSDDSFYGSDTEAGIMDVYYDSLTLLQRSARLTPEVPPYTKIARMSIALADHPNRIHAIEYVSKEDKVPGNEDIEHPIDAMCCLEAEPRLASSLAKRSSDRTETYPAAILYDVNQDPFAYQKGNGAALAFTWRDAEVITGKGIKWVPKNSIIRALYEPGYNPRGTHSGDDLLAIGNPHIRLAHFLRFMSASWLPPALAYEAAIAGRKRVDELRVADAQEAAQLKGQRLGDKVLSLLGKAQVIDR